jgi:F420H(2)-dependent quinone reductase
VPPFVGEGEPSPFWSAALFRLGLWSAAVEDRDAILRSLLDERTVDIVTTGRRSGAMRTTEIWTTVVDGQTYICGTPNASKPGVERQPRDWLANLLSTPDFIVRLKASVHVDLPAKAERVDDAGERRRVLTAPNTEYYRDAVSLDMAMAHSPMVRVQFIGDAAWLAAAVRSGPPQA